MLEPREILKRLRATYLSKSVSLNYSPKKIVVEKLWRCSSLKGMIIDHTQGTGVSITEMQGESDASIRDSRFTSFLSLKKHKAHRGAKGPKSRGAHLKDARRTFLRKYKKFIQKTYYAKRRCILAKTQWLDTITTGIRS